MLRRIDFGFQLLIIIAGFTSCIIAPLFGALALFVLGIWQLLSAVSNTLLVKHDIGFRKRIRIYWLLVLTNLSGWFICTILLHSRAIYFGIGLVLMITAAMIGLYYCNILYELIRAGNIKEQLSSVVKENHF